MFETVYYETVVLEKIRFYLRKSCLGATVMDSLKCTLVDYWDRKGEEIAFEITGYVMGEKVDEINLPPSWWQMFKEECFPKWLKKIWKVKYKDIAKIYATYPKLNEALPKDRQQAVIFKIVKEPFSYRENLG